MTPSIRERSPWAVASIVWPLLIVILGVVVALFTPAPQYDMIGASRWLKAGIGVLIGSVSALLLSATSFARREAQASMSLCTSIPAAVFLLWLGRGWVLMRHQESETARLKSVATRMETDSTYRKDYLRQNAGETGELFALLHGKPRASFDVEDITLLWNKYKVNPGSFCAVRGWIIALPNTPESILREYYHLVLQQAEKREGKPNVHDLAYENELLRHPNLPDDIIAEIQGYHLGYLDEILSSNPKLKTKGIQGNDQNSFH